MQEAGSVFSGPGLSGFAALRVFGRSLGSLGSLGFKGEGLSIDVTTAMGLSFLANLERPRSLTPKPDCTLRP